MELLPSGPSNAGQLGIQIIQELRSCLRQIDCHKQPLARHWIVFGAIASLLSSIAASASPVNHRAGKSVERLCQPVCISLPEASTGWGRIRLTIFIKNPVRFGAIGFPAIAAGAASVSVNGGGPRRQAATIFRAARS